MKDYVILCDSTADLPIDTIKKMNMGFIPFTYSIDEKVFNYTLTEDEQYIIDFYDNLKSGAMPVTSQVNPVTYKEYFEKYTNEGKAVIYICFSSGLSGSYHSANLGADLVREDNENAEITIIDSLCASIGEGVLAYASYEKMEQGASYEEMIEWIKEVRTHISHWFMVEDLFHLKRGGRVSTVEAVVGSALKIKPILSVDEEGKLVVKSKARGTLKALDYIATKFKEEFTSSDNTFVVIGHAASSSKAEQLKKIAMDNGVSEDRIIIASIGPIIGTHVGAGMAAIAYIRL